MPENETNANQMYLRTTTILAGNIVEKRFRKTMYGNPYLFLRILVKNEQNNIKAKMPVICFDKMAIELNHVEIGDLVAVGGVFNHYFKDYDGTTIARPQIHAHAVAKVMQLNHPHEYKVEGEIFGDKSYLHELQRIAS